MYVKKTDSPANARQIYIDGVRYRSVFQAAIDTDCTAVGLYNLLKKSGGAPVARQNKQIVVAEDWLLSHPDYLLKTMGEEVEIDGGSEN